MIPSTIIHIPSSTAPGYTVPVTLEAATMEQAITWMNAPTNVLERFDRKYALLTYLNASINLAAIKETKVPEGG